MLVEPKGPHGRAAVDELHLVHRKAGSCARATVDAGRQMGKFGDVARAMDDLVFKIVKKCVRG